MMISFHYSDDSVDYVRQTAATLALFFQPMENFGWHDQLPGIIIKQVDDDLFDFFLTDDVAMTNQHGRLNEFKV